MVVITDPRHLSIFALILSLHLISIAGLTIGNTAIPCQSTSSFVLNMTDCFPQHFRVSLLNRIQKDNNNIHANIPTPADPTAKFRMHYDLIGEECSLFSPSSVRMCADATWKARCKSTLLWDDVDKWLVSYKNTCHQAAYLSTQMCCLENAYRLMPTCSHTNHKQDKCASDFCDLHCQEQSMVIGGCNQRTVNAVMATTFVPYRCENKTVVTCPDPIQALKLDSCGNGTTKEPDTGGSNEGVSPIYGVANHFWWLFGLLFALRSVHYS